MREDLPAEVFMNFASDDDVQSVKRWRVSSRLRTNVSMSTRAADACEFAKLAAKRWRHYRDTRTFASSLEALHHLIATDPHGEYCFHLKITAAWFPGILGAAMVRRTWCHHLMIDFLFVHPDICGKLVGIKTVGLQILQSICLLARELGCKRVWGEATLDSASFYQRQLGKLVEDHFAIEKSEIARFAKRLQSFPKPGLNTKAV
jgi:hypothetical protein